MLTVGEEGSIIKELIQEMEQYLKDTQPHYYPPVENLLDLVYEHYTENNSIAPENTVAGKAAKEKEKELETWLRGLPRMDEMVEDYCTAQDVLSGADGKQCGYDCKKFQRLYLLSLHQLSF